MSKPLDQWKPFEHIERACELTARADLDEHHLATGDIRCLKVAELHLRIAEVKMIGKARAS